MPGSVWSIVPNSLADWVRYAPSSPYTDTQRGWSWFCKNWLLQPRPQSLSAHMRWMALNFGHVNPSRSSTIWKWNTIESSRSGSPT